LGRPRREAGASGLADLAGAAYSARNVLGQSVRRREDGSKENLQEADKDRQLGR